MSKEGIEGVAVLPYNSALRQNARDLRSNMTDAERLLWFRVRRKQLNGCLFGRQRIIGDYIVDFYCHEARLVIELDGGQHYLAENTDRDRRRDDYLRSLGLQVLRFSDRDVLQNIQGVLEVILGSMRSGGRQPP